MALIVASAVAFLLGYGAAAQAWPGVPDRTEWRGYFQNIQDTWGDEVLLGGIPAAVNDANSLVEFIRSKLASGSARDRIGAAFIVQIMLAEPWNRNNPPTPDQMSDWESRVWRAHHNGWISWDIDFTYTGNSYWQGGGVGINPNDDAFTYENGTRRAIVFRNGSGETVAVLKRDCANPLTNGYMPGLEELWNSTGWTDVEPTANPGQTVTFRHYVENFGDTAARIWFATIEGASSAGTGLPGIGGS